MKKIAFTLAEIMIVFTIIAIITAILLPSARNAMPNEDIMKFKKAHNTLYSVIRELVTSDKYYLNGDLGIRANGKIISSSIDEDAKYLIATMADVLNTNYIEPKAEAGRKSQFGLFSYDCMSGSSKVADILDGCSGSEVTPEIISERKESIDKSCVYNTSQYAKQIITSDGIWYWDPYAAMTLGHSELYNTTTGEAGGRRFFHLTDNNGLYILYKTFCMDIDGVPQNATVDNCVNECPFAYGIRADGKIFTSKKVDEWLEKSIQEKNN